MDGAAASSEIAKAGPSTKTFNTNAQAASNGPPAAQKNSMAGNNGKLSSRLIARENYRPIDAKVAYVVILATQTALSHLLDAVPNENITTSLLGGGGGGDGGEPLGKNLQVQNLWKTVQRQSISAKALRSLPYVSLTREASMTANAPSSYPVVTDEASPRCEVCQLVVKSQQSLLSHMNVRVQVHGKEMLHCVKCAVPFINPQALAHHFKSCVKPLPANIQPDMDMPPPLPIPPSPPAPPTHSKALPQARPTVALPSVLPGEWLLPLFVGTRTYIPLLLKPPPNLPPLRPSSRVAAAPTPPPAPRRSLRRLLPVPQVVPLTAPQEACPLDLSLPSKPPKPQRSPSLQQLSVAQADVRAAIPLPVQVNQFGVPSVVLRFPSERQLHVRSSNTALSLSVGGNGSAIGRWYPQSKAPVDQRQTLAG
ncbi:hypothetical protein RvY_18297 [Ramazzottius varieornatus]|uniref:Uncharacterized protein n=1 Tax=Ramazzottius varieornatus TaxID=947166 RepID=A0A1D1W6X1_RAMVA|nr:hypothetical protein RvY_18297 [Ramazzottius varieornatus]